MRIVVLLPAPLLPRKPKISPARTSKLSSSTAVKSPKRRVRRRTSMAPAPSPATRPLQLRFRETDARQRPRAIQLGLQ